MKNCIYLCSLKMLNICCWPLDSSMAHRSLWGTLPRVGHQMPAEASGCWVRQKNFSVPLTWHFSAYMSQIWSSHFFTTVSMLLLMNNLGYITTPVPFLQNYYPSCQVPFCNSVINYSYLNVDLCGLPYLISSHIFSTHYTNLLVFHPSVCLQLPSQMGVACDVPHKFNMHVR